ncbi:MAG: hypothetical protein GY777_14425 [Candidatus Brocadiaceae bacterium]|nr:hypothetical protein [Candidatus Brocadiaceae bacterium]
MEEAKEPWLNYIVGGVSSILEKLGVISEAAGIGGAVIADIFSPGGPGKRAGSITGGILGAAYGAKWGYKIHPLYGTIAGVAFGGALGELFFPDPEAGIAY